MDRLQKIIAQAGITSRRKAEELIVQGKVKVDGQVITELGYKPNKGAKIVVNGQEIKKEDKVYFLMNKPKKVLSSVSDDRGRQTVVDIMTDVKERVYPVGRLDYDTTGVLILTNDGEFANELVHPRFQLEKTYEVTINGELTVDQIKMLEKGIELDDGLTLPAKVKVTSRNGSKTTCFEIRIKEGRNREIRRMMEYFGHDVTRLNRKKLGTITADGLKQGEYRVLKPFEIKQLKKIVNGHD